VLLALWHLSALQQPLHCSIDVTKRCNQCWNKKMYKYTRQVLKAWFCQDSFGKPQNLTFCLIITSQRINGYGRITILMIAPKTWHINRKHIFPLSISGFPDFIDCQSLGQWLRLALSKGPNWGVSTPFTWGQKQTYFPKRFLWYLEFRLINKIQKPSNSECCTPSSEPFWFYIFPQLYKCNELVIFRVWTVTSIPHPQVLVT
jgi:hypothetical protein